MNAAAVQPGDALLLVDVQNDFLPGGALGIAGADAIVPVLNQYLRYFTPRRLPIFASRDWHPENHCSFHEQGGRWPVHCVAHTHGAEFSHELQLPALAITVSKATTPGREALSAFAGTELAAQLQARGVQRLFVGGLATDYCVLHTVCDALRRGFRVHVLADAIRAVDSSRGDGELAIAEMQRCGALLTTLEDFRPANPGLSSLLVDQYHFTMLRGYLASHMEESAVFEFFVRKLPANWNFLVTAGLASVLDFLESVRFSPADLEWLETHGGFGPDVLRELATWRFTGDVHAMPEGTVFFPDEPILRVTAPIMQAQLVETRLLNLLHFQTLIASKAARCVLAAPEKTLIEFGARRAHGAEASLFAARSCYVAGFQGTSNVLAAQQFGIPLSGTMAHSFIQAFDEERDAFLAFARANPDNVVLLLDTYDTEAAAKKVVALAPALRAEGIAIKGVRLDSGDLAEHAREVRHILDQGGLRQVIIFASGNIDEYGLHSLGAETAPIDGYGIGTRVVTAADSAYLDCAYKLQEYAGQARCKHSEGKATWPGAKQVYRHSEPDGRITFDVVATADETRLGRPLLTCVMRNGRRTLEEPSLADVAAHARDELAHLPSSLRSLDGENPFPVTMSQPLRALARRLGASVDGAGALQTATESVRLA